MFQNQDDRRKIIFKNLIQKTHCLIHHFLSVFIPFFKDNHFSYTVSKIIVILVFLGVFWKQVYQLQIRRSCSIIACILVVSYFNNTYQCNIRFGANLISLFVVVFCRKYNSITDTFRIF